MNLVTGKANLFLSQNNQAVCWLIKFLAVNGEQGVWIQRWPAQGLHDALDGLVFTWMICRADWLVSVSSCSGSLSVLGAEGLKLFGALPHSTLRAEGISSCSACISGRLIRPRSPGEVRILLLALALTMFDWVSLPSFPLSRVPQHYKNLSPTVEASNTSPCIITWLGKRN